VGVTSDGGFVLIHDTELDRETTGRGPLRAVTTAEFTRLRLRDADEPTATLGDAVEALRLTRRPLKVQVDFKEALPVAEEIAVGLLAALAPLRANPQLEVVVGCLADWNLRALRRLDPTLAVGLDFYIYLDAPGEDALRLPQRVNAYGYLDDHPLGYRWLLPVSAYLEDRLETLVNLLPGAKEIYVHKAFLVQALRDGINPIAVIRRLRPDILVDVWLINADDTDFASSLAVALDAGADQITTDTSVQLARYVAKTLAAAEPSR
jgi:glycerophosphoryl diester phosphodiesterase